MTTSRVASPLTANQSRWPTSSVFLALVMLKCSRVGRPEVSAGLTNVSPSAPEIGQRSQTSPPPLTGWSAEYFDAVTGNGVTRFSSPSNSTVTVAPSTGVASGASTGSRPPAAGRPSGERANGEGVAEESGTRYGRQPSGKERSPVWTSYTGSKPRQERNARYRPSPVNTGFSSSKRPLVTSTITGAPGPMIRASLICRSERPIPGWDQVSQAPSGENARSRTGPLMERISSVGSPVDSSAVSRRSRRPSFVAIASRSPSGSEVNSWTRPICPEAEAGAAPGVHWRAAGRRSRSRPHRPRP